MSRLTTTNYLADADTSFQYATDDSDEFDRNDVSYLARAVDRHDHTPGRGVQLTSEGFADASIEADKLATGSVTTAKLADTAVTAAKIGTGAVTTAKILDNAVTSAKIAADQVTATHIATDAVGAAEIVAGGVGTAELADLAVTNGKIAANTIDLSTKAAVGSLTGSRVAATTLDGDTVLIPDSVTGNVGTSAIGVNCIHANRLVDGSLSSAEFARWTGSGAVVATANILDGNVTAAKLSSDVASVPLGAHCWFETAAAVAAAGVKWTTASNLAGRMPIGAGTTGSQTFTQQNNYGTTWTPVTGLSASSSSSDASGSTYALAAAGGGPGSFNASQLDHSHGITTTINGQASVWIPPVRAGVWAYRSS